ncbi:MAG: TolC family protein [Candidatus Cloacimonadaceae bacterium]|nr:TolC family protein [Candidatus Cloacimonadaceae bacterium]
MRKQILILFTIALAISLSANTITLDEAKAMALENNSDYQAKAAALKSSEWAKTGAMSSFLPSLSLSGTYLYMDPATQVQTGAGSISLNKDMRTISLNLSQPLFVGGKLWQAYLISKMGEDIAVLNLQSQQLKLINEVESKYLSILQLLELDTISRLDRDSAVRNMEIAQLKLESGIIAMADYLRFKSRQASKEVSLLQAETALQIALKDFANYLGSEDVLTPQALSGDKYEAMLAILDGYDTGAMRTLSLRLQKLGQDQNLSLKLIDRGVEISRRSYDISKGSFMPTVMLTGSRQYKENGIDRYEFSPSDQIMLNVSIPILPQIGNYAANRKAFYEHKKAQWEAVSAKSGITLGIDAAVMNLVSSAKQVNAAKLARDYTEASYEQILQRYQLNMISSLELLDADLMLSSARIAYTNSLFSFYKNRSALIQILALNDPAILDAQIQSISVEE